MEFASTMLIFVFGLCSGVAIMLLKQRLDNGSEEAQQALHSCKQENAQLKQNWQDHLAEYRSLATNLQEMSQHIHHQVEDAEQLILAETKSAPSIPFFSAEATNILKSVSRKKREKSSLDDQPLDYSGSPSGMFQGTPPNLNSNTEKH